MLPSSCTQAGPIAFLLLQHGRFVIVLYIAGTFLSTRNTLSRIQNQEILITDLGIVYHHDRPKRLFEESLAFNGVSKGVTPPQINISPSRTGRPSAGLSELLVRPL